MRFSKNFYLLLFIQMMKQAALWIAIIKLPIYVAQKDTVGGLGWDQSTKGLIFFIWVLFQNLSASGFGIFADKFSKKKLLFISHFLMIIGYTMISFSRDKISFFAAVIFLGLGSGIFKPIMEGSFAGELSKSNSNRGWSLFIIAVNVAVILATFFMDFLDNYSWTHVFLGSTFILILDLVFLTRIKDQAVPQNINIIQNLKVLLSKKQLWQVTIAMIGFTTIYMQFYEMLPNFIYDWVDSKKLAVSLPYFSEEYPTGLQIDIKWYYQLMSVFIIIAIIPLNKFISKTSIINSIIIGLLFVCFGWLLSGLTQSANFLIIGMIIYTIGEMIVRPKFFEFASNLSSEGDRILHMSLVNFSYAMGYMIGALSGGYIYQNYGEKAGFLELEKFSSVSQLWDNFNPSISFYPYFALGVVSILFLIYIRKKV